MQKKSSDNDELDNVLSQLAEGDIYASVILMITKEGERIYLHKFESDVAALDFMEQMVSSYRVDMIELAIKRSTN
jgi:hypothetical protein